MPHCEIDSHEELSVNLNVQLPLLEEEVEIMITRCQRKKLMSSFFLKTLPENPHSVHVPESNFYSLSECIESNEAVSTDVDNEIDCYNNKSKLHLDGFINSMMQRISNLHLNGKANDEIYKLFGDLVKQIQTFNVNLLNEDPAADPKQVLNATTEYIYGKFYSKSSAYRRQNENKTNPLFVAPKELSLGLKWEMVRDKLTKTAVPRLTNCKFTYIQITDIIQALFKRDDFRQVYWEYNSNSNDRHRCVEGVLKDFCCGRVYSKNELFQSNPAAIRIHISNDDFEICNPLGSKATMHKLSAFYFTIQNMPPQFRSQLDNIYLFCLCYADDLKTKYTDINDIWQIVARDIGFLETHGINTEYGRNIKGTIAYLSFDNLGANLALGFVACFRAQFFCRFCVMPIEECRYKCQEDTSKRRKTASYNETLQLIENSTIVDFKATKGVKTKCILNELSYFHMLKNLSVDPMHDLNEGIVPFALKQLFMRMIQLKLYSEEKLVQKIQYFDYGFLNQRNVPSGISLDKANLGQNASQMKCLLQHIPFIFWKYRENMDLYKVWTAIKSLLQIFFICYSSEFTRAQINKLRSEITLHLMALRDLDLTFLPKHHIITHYPFIIEEMGPVVFMNMIRFDGKHKMLKSFMSNNSNFTNITYTIARKHQEHLSTVTDSYTVKFIVGETKNLSVKILNVFNHHFRDFAILNEIKQEINFFKYCNHHYKKELFVFDQNKFHEIQHIFKHANEFYFVCVPFNVIFYNDFLNSFKIERATNPIYTMIQYSNLKYKAAYEKKITDGSIYIICDTLILVNYLNHVIN